MFGMGTGVAPSLWSPGISSVFLDFNAVVLSDRLDNSTLAAERVEPVDSTKQRIKRFRSSLTTD